MTNHPMQPSEAQFHEWCKWNGSDDSPVIFWKRLAHTAYSAGADAQLSADTKWVRTEFGSAVAEALRDAMRPKPPSLAEQGTTALADLEELVAFILQGAPTTRLMIKGRTPSELLPAIRRALERLAELEAQANG